MKAGNGRERDRAMCRDEVLLRKSATITRGTRVSKHMVASTAAKRRRCDIASLSGTVCFKTREKGSEVYQAHERRCGDGKQERMTGFYLQ